MEGNTATGDKNISHDKIKLLCGFLIKNNYIPIILDWDNRSHLPDQSTIFCPNTKDSLWGGNGTGDAEIIAALIDQCVLFIGVDSGPLHVAMSTKTPTIGLWTKHHPIHYADFSNNTIHLIPKNHTNYVRGGHKNAALEYFYYKYKYLIYDNLLEEIINAIDVHLNESNYIIDKPKPKPVINDSFLKSHKYDKNYYEEHKNAGLDYCGFGGWQKNYGNWIVDVFSLKDKVFLDIGCACGSISNGIYSAGAKKVFGIDINNHTIERGKKEFPHLNLNVCDAINMHLFENNSIDFVHTNQVAEHWRPEHVPLIFDEIHRVLKKDGVFLCVLDTQELYDRQKRDVAREDPTHICIKPLSWWYDIANKNFKILKMERFTTHPGSFLKQYDWDYFILQKSAKKAFI